jgi:hypothetical protein
MAQLFSGASSFDHDLGTWNVERVLQMDGMLSGTALGVENYDATLIGWAAQDVQEGLSLWCEAQYSDAAQPARDYLVTERGWHIEDGGLVSVSPR